MPEVKWAHKQSLHDAEELKRLISVLDGVQPYMVPVLTLDQIEAWLEDNRLTVRNCKLTADTIRENNWTIEKLLAQVQAWKDGK